MFDLSKKKLLVIAPHPDDEVLGCAGLIHKIKKSGGKVYVLFLSISDTRDFSGRGSSTAGERQKEITAVSRFLKFDGYDIAFRGSDFHLNLDVVGQHKIMDVIERKSTVSLEKIKPDILAFPDVNSYNQDHRLAALSAHAAVRPAERRLKHFVPAVLSYEMPVDSWTLEGKFTPNFNLPLTRRELDVKLKAWKLYKSQIRNFPNPRSPETVEHFAVYRGSLAGTDFAESYFAYRITV